MFLTCGLPVRSWLRRLLAAGHGAGKSEQSKRLGCVVLGVLVRCFTDPKGDLKTAENAEHAEGEFLTTDFTDEHGWGQTTKYAKYTNTDPESLTAEYAEYAEGEF